jgi:hypothetical protein
LALSARVVAIHQYAEIRRLFAIGRDVKSRAREPETEQFAYRSGPAWHSLLETKIIHRREFRWRQHDLEAFTAIESTHLQAPRREKLGCN